MSGIGFWELIILFLIGLIVLGPKRLPQVANQLGEWIGQAKRMTRVMRRQLEEEIDLNDLDQNSINLPKEDVSRPQFVNDSPDYNQRPPEPEAEPEAEAEPEPEAEPSSKNTN